MASEVPTLTALPINITAKAVRFLSIDNIKFVERPTLEGKDKTWYSEEELNQSKLNFARDVNLFSNLVIARIEQGNNLTEEERDNCLGLEHLIARDVKQRWVHVVRLQKRHLCTVLIEQARQKYFQDYSMEELSRISRESSSDARDFSHAMALLIMPTCS